MRLPVRALLASTLATLLCRPAFGQVTHAQPDLVFPKEVRELSMFSSLAMGVWKPAGDGPFPALVIVHSCGGLKPQIALWRREAVARGYVAFVIDAFSSRGSPNCRPSAPIPMTRGVKDVLDAAAHLATLPVVDKARIATIGFSWGGMAAMLTGSPTYAADVAPGRDPLAAAVSLYAACYIGPFGDFPGNVFLRPDQATPTLLLMGGRDTETPPQECVSRLPGLQTRNAPVEAHVFDSATHCWDCREQHNFRWSPPWSAGRQVVYEYDPKVTEESIARVFAFLAQRMGIPVR
jgi:dienelactone hydrolase